MDSTTNFCQRYARSQFLQNPIKDSWLLTSHFLMFKPYRATHELIPSENTHSHASYLYFWEELNQNPRQYTCDYTTQLTHVSQSRPFSSKWPIFYLKQNCFISSRTIIDQSLSFESPNIYFKNSCQATPILSLEKGFERLYLVCILDQLWLYSI